MEKKNENIAGNEQSNFAGTNPDRHGNPKPADQQDNPIEDQEAQNVVDGSRMTGKDAADARNKANTGKEEGEG